MRVLVKIVTSKGEVGQYILEEVIHVECINNIISFKHENGYISSYGLDKPKYKFTFTMI